MILWPRVILLLVATIQVRQSLPWNMQSHEDNNAKVFTEEEKVVEEPIDESKSNFESEVKSFELQQEKNGASSKHTVEKAKHVKQTCVDVACDDSAQLSRIEKKPHDKNETSTQERKAPEKKKIDMILVNENDSESAESTIVKGNQNSENGATIKAIPENQIGKNGANTLKADKLKKYDPSKPSSSFEMHGKKNCTSPICLESLTKPKGSIEKQTKLQPKLTPTAKEKSTNQSINVNNYHNQSENSPIKPNQNSKTSYLKKPLENVFSNINGALSEKENGTSVIDQLLKEIEKKNNAVEESNVGLKSNCTETLCTINHHSETKKENSEIQFRGEKFPERKDSGERFEKHNKELEINGKELENNGKVEFSNGSLKNTLKLKESLNEIIKKLTKIGKSEKDISEVQEEYDENNDLTISSARNIDCAENCSLDIIKKQEASNSSQKSENENESEKSASEKIAPENSKSKINLNEQEEKEETEKLSDDFQSALKNISITNGNELNNTVEVKNESDPSTNEKLFNNETTSIYTALENNTKENCTDCSMLREIINIELERASSNKTSQLLDTNDNSNSSNDSQSVPLNELNSQKRIETLVKLERDETDNILNVGNEKKSEYSLLRTAKVYVPNQNRHAIATNSSSEFLAEILPKSKDKDSNAIKKNDCTNASCLNNTKTIFSTKSTDENEEPDKLVN